MPDGPDFRADKSESTEGQRVAAGRWGSFHCSLDEDVVAEAYSTPGKSMEDLPADVRNDIASNVLERSGLIGFWVAWRLAGGFANLERGGWHRATIFRKVSRFRAAYGAHPDEYVFPWIQLDLNAAWSDQISRRLERARTGELFS